MTRAAFPVLEWTNVPSELLDQKWEVVVTRRRECQEGMPVLESRAPNTSVPHAVRNSATVGRRLLVLFDSMPSVLRLVEHGEIVCRGDE